MQSSWEILAKLKALGHLRDDRDGFWWPNAFTEEIVISAILTQNTRWDNVEKALLNLRQQNATTLESLCALNPDLLSTLIRPAGFYNVKAKRLRDTARVILDEFGDFTTFQEQVGRDWLLAQKGLGEESVDAILCYGCGREIMVMDAYTLRIMQAFSYDFETYSDMQAWFHSGIESSWDRVVTLYDDPTLTLHRLYARFHGKIVEYGKEHSHRKQMDVTPLCE